MRKSLVSFKNVALIAAVACAAAAMPLTSARTRTAAAAITVVNNSQREIRHLYLSPPERDDWGADLLNESAITPGNSFTFNGGWCGDAGVKVVAEDKDGCFLSAVLSCAEDATWTITSDTPADCGN